jgi:hypothetical protein
MAAVIAFLFLSSYARKETVTSYLTPAAGTVHVFQPRLGAISAVQVTQGQTVTEEQLMFTVAVDQITTEGKDVDATILVTLENQKQSITRQIAAQMSMQAERVRVAKNSSLLAPNCCPRDWFPR